MRNIILLTEAVSNLYPNRGFTLDGDDLSTLVFADNTVADTAAVLVEYARVEAAYNSQEYARNRAAEYPPIGDQLDALWKGGEAAAEMLAKVQAVKAKYPKPTE